MEPFDHLAGCDPVLGALVAAHGPLDEEERRRGRPDDAYGALLRAIVGLVESTGDVLVDGSPLALRTRRRRAELIAFVPQSPVIPEDMTGFEYVLLGRSPYVGYFGTESRHDKSMVHGVLARLELRIAVEEFLGRFPEFELAEPADVGWSVGQIRGPRRLPVRILS